MSFRRECRLPIDFERDRLIEFLDESHPILIVGICPIEFHIRELLKVLRTRSLIAVGAPDLEGLRESTCHESLLPEFADTDAHIDIDIEVIVMGREGSCLRSTRRMLDRRSLDLEKSFCFHKIASHFPEFRLAVEHRTEVIVHRHIEVSLSIALIVI